MIWIAPSEEATVTDTLEKRLWDAAEQALPAPISGLKSQEYSGGRPPGPVLGLIFLHFTHPMSEGASLGRETKGEVVLVSRLRAALERLSTSRTGSPALLPEGITAAVDELTRDMLLPRLRSGQIAV